MSLFEKVSHAKVKDCFELSPKNLVFVVLPNELAKAVGKKGSNVKKLESMFKKNIRIIEYDPKIEKFIANLCLPNKIKTVDFSEQMLWDSTKRAAVITPESLKSRGFIIGKDASNLRLMETICRRYFQIDEIRVVPADKLEDKEDEEDAKETLEILDDDDTEALSAEEEAKILKQVEDEKAEKDLTSEEKDDKI